MRETLPLTIMIPRVETLLRIRVALSTSEKAIITCHAMVVLAILSNNAIGFEHLLYAAMLA